MSEQYQAVLFDCDGVLVDSEPITAFALRQCLEERGWNLSFEECCRIFIGKAVRDERARIEQETGKPLTEEWMAYFYGVRNQLLEEQLLIVDGALQAVASVHERFDARIACASGADRHKLGLQLNKTGLMPYFAERIFSGQELPRNKPSPDVYLAAAAALQIEPQRCFVVEDSLTGARAGLAAGACVIGYAPGGHNAQALRELGARSVISHMQELPGAIAALQQSVAVFPA